MKIKPLRPVRFPERYVNRAVDLSLLVRAELSGSFFPRSAFYFSSNPDKEYGELSWSITAHVPGGRIGVVLPQVAKLFFDWSRSRATSTY